MNRFHKLGVLMIGIAAAISACAPAPSASVPPLVPAEGKLTFVFTYTEG